MLNGSYGVTPPDLEGLLEPDAGRLARPVPRGARRRKAPGLPARRSPRSPMVDAGTLHMHHQRRAASWRRQRAYGLREKRAPETAPVPL